MNKTLQQTIFILSIGLCLATAVSAQVLGWGYNNDGELGLGNFSAFGNYNFQDLTAGETCILSVATRRFSFFEPSRVITLYDDLADEDFISKVGLSSTMLDDRTNEIIFVGFGDADIIDCTDLRFEIFGHVVDEDVAVDFLCLAFEAALE